MDICTSLFALMIVGAYEYRPGLMHVEQINTKTGEITELIVYTDDYLSCWENGVPVRGPGSTDGGGTSTPLNS